jgi:hypothetical protein
VSRAISQSAFDTSLRRYGRSWGLWLLLLVAPIGARYMIPHGDGTGVVIAIGQHLPVMTAAFLGVSLGIVVSTLLLPIAWIYLRSNTTRRQPWQVEEVTAASRVAIALGRFGADAAVLLGVLAALTVAGWILGLLIPLEGGFHAGEIALGLWLVAAPALLGIAALRILFDAMPAMRGGFGDFLYFVTWMASLIAPIGAADRAASFAANMYDFPGFVRPLQYGAPGGGTDFAIGGIEVLAGTIKLDVMAGLFSPGYIAARLAWAAIAVALVVVAGLVYRPHRATQRQLVPGRLARWTSAGPPPAVAAVPVVPKRIAVPLLGLIIAEARLILAGRLNRLLALGALALAVLHPDFRHVASPAALLLMVFAFSAQAGRSEARGLLRLTATAPQSPMVRRVAFVIAGSVLALGFALPGLLHAAPSVVLTAFVVGSAAAVIAMALATLSGSAFAGRALLCIVWYVYLSS